MPKHAADMGQQHAGGDNGERGITQPREPFAHNFCSEVPHLCRRLQRRTHICKTGTGYHVLYSLHSSHRPIDCLRLYWLYSHVLFYVGDKVRCTLGGDWSRLGSPQTVRPNMLSYFGLLSVTARFGIPRALTLTHLVAFLATRAVWLWIHAVALSHCICLYFYSHFMSLVAEACLTREPKMVSLTCI
jgi:hypothetical protein